MPISRSRTLAPACALALCAAPLVAQKPPQGAERTRLEQIEDLSESLANDMLDLSLAVRDRDRARVARYFADTAAAEPFPTSPGALQPLAKWVAQRTWSPPPGAPAGARATPRDVLLDQLFLYLGHFDDVEDARFKVRGATFADDARAQAGTDTPTAVPGAGGEVQMRFWLVGRNRAGRREWATLNFSAGVRFPAGGPWRFEALRGFDLKSKAATVDLFDEVSAPAGLAAALPAYGSPGNTGFAWKGAAAADADGDGWIDLFVSSPERNHVYRNRGDGTFEDVSGAAGVRPLASGTAPLFLDFDDDGDQDVFIAAVGRQVLLENRLVPDGRLAFEDVSLERGVALPAVGFSAAAADVNGDGRPDIYVASYNHYGRVTPDSWSAATNGTPNLLFVSQPDGNYREQGARWGVADRRWSYAAAFADFTGDGRPDLYVANDFGENGFFIHHGERFNDEAAERGVLDTGNGMGVSVGDWDNDGRLDLHVTNMSSTAGNRILGRLFPGQGPGQNPLIKLAAGNNLYLNLGAGRFRDVTAQVGGISAQWAWGGGFVDFDNDSREDLYTPNGFISGKSMKDT